MHIIMTRELDMWLNVAVFVGYTIIIIIGTYFYYNNEDDNEDSNQS